MSDLPPDERQVSPVGGGSRLLKSKNARVALLTACGVGVAGFLALGVHSALNDKGPEEKPSDIGATLIAQITPAPPLPPPPESPKPPEPQKTQIIYMPSGPGPVAAQAQSAPPGVVAGAIDYVRFPAGNGGEGTFDVPSPAHDRATGGGGDGTSSGSPDSSKDRQARTEVAFKPSVIGGGKAGPAIRLTYVMLPQLIPCSLDTGMESTLAGAIMCHTTVDVLSPEHVLLLPARTLIVGSYKNDVRNGQHRLFAFAGNAITKEGIPVPLNSGIADGVGRAGIEGDVDNHYLERFGAALMLTAADAAVSIAETELSKQGQTSLNLGGGGSGIGGIANQILQSQINIPPTISVPPGAIVSIVVDHPIDFSDVIKVAIK